MTPEENRNATTISFTKKHLPIFSIGEVLFIFVVAFLPTSP